jgi:hypothetical protein
MKEADVTLIHNDLQLLYDQLRFENIRANIFLRPVRATSEIMSKYAPFSGKITFKKILFTSAKMFLSTIFHTLKFLYRNLRSTSDYKTWKKAITKDLDSVFLSHYLGDRKDGNNDIFFGPLPQIANDFGRKSIVLLINHTKHREINYASSDSNSPKYILLPKSNSFPTVIKVLFSQISVGIQIIKLAIFNQNLTARQRLLLIATAAYQLHTGTLSNLILWVNLENFVHVNRVHTLFLTFEGHSYEALICENFNQKVGELKIYMYQHGPITLQQFGLTLSLQDPHTNITVLTSGEVTKDFLLHKNPLLEGSIINIGSQKFQASENQVTTSGALLQAKKSSNTLLFAPEGVMGCTIKFLEFAVDAATCFSDIHFLFRIHPHLSGDEVQAWLRIRKPLPVNFSFSSNNLVDDLSLSFGCIYRSSAVAIQGLGYGVQPIFFDEGSGNGLDPINPNLIPHKSFRDAEEFKALLLEIRETWESDFTHHNYLWRNFQNRYYSKFDSKILGSLFDF